MMAEPIPARHMLPESLSSSRHESPVVDRPRSRFRIKSELRVPIKVPPLSSSQTNASTHFNKNNIFPSSKTPLRRPQISKTDKLGAQLEGDPASDYYAKPAKFLGVELSASRRKHTSSSLEPHSNHSNSNDESGLQTLNPSTTKLSRFTPLASNILNNKLSSGLKPEEPLRKSVSLKASLARSRRTRQTSDPLNLLHDRSEQSPQQENNLMSKGIEPPAILPLLDPTRYSQKDNGAVKAYAANTNQGIVRNYNEDRVSIILNIVKPANMNYEGEWPSCSFFGIYDGHGGALCADFLRDNLHQYVIKDENFPFNPIDALKNGFKEAEKKFTELAQSQQVLNKSGSCAIVALLVDSTVYIANVGDSRAVMSCEQGKRIVAMSRDHKPNDELEKDRITSNGGRIYQSQSQGLRAGSMLKNSGYAKTLYGPHRVFPGRLSVSRAFGDVEAKLEQYGGLPGVVIAEPEIMTFSITESEDFIVLGCDGIYDKMSNEEVIRSIWNSTKLRGRDLHHQSSIAVGSLLNDAMMMKTLDNVTAVMISLEGFKKGLLFMEPAEQQQQQLVKSAVSAEKLTLEALNKEYEGRLKTPTVSYQALKKSMEIERENSKKFDTPLSRSASRKEMESIGFPSNLRRDVIKGDLNQALEDYGTLEYITKRSSGAQRHKSTLHDRVNG